MYDLCVRGVVCKLCYENKMKRTALSIQLNITIMNSSVIKEVRFETFKANNMYIYRNLSAS